MALFSATGILFALVGLVSAWVTAEQIGQLDIRQQRDWRNPACVDACAAGRHESRIKALAAWVLVASLVTLAVGLPVTATAVPPVLVLFGALTILTAFLALVLSLMCVTVYPMSVSTWVTTGLYLATGGVTLSSMHYVLT